MNKTTELRSQLVESQQFILSKTDFSPEIAIILGTGLGDLTNYIETELELPYKIIPNFPVSTVEFHAGKLIFGTLASKKIVAMQGRFHYYEGYSLNQITFPIRLLKMLGCSTLILSNACGSLNPRFKCRDIMLIEDHINLIGHNPLRGINDNTFGPRFADMCEPYSLRLINLAEETASQLKIKLHKGVYVAMNGPSLETKAEYKFLRIIGADVVGMSTVPENIVARQMNMDVLGISIVTDECFHEKLKPVSIDEILTNAGTAEKDLTKIIIGVLNKI